MSSLQTRIETKVISTPNSDLKVVNAARVSFSKEHHEVKPKDAGLIKYLATHAHWTPFAHCRETYAVVMTPTEVLHFLMGLTQEDFAAMVWRFDGHDTLYVRTSIWGWSVMNAGRFVGTAGKWLGDVAYDLSKKYPLSAPYLFPDASSSGDEMVQIPYHIESDPYFKDLTLKHTVPIYVARQDFKHVVGRVFNEVSRRYVDDDPIIYHPDVWRSRADNVKQGSSDNPAPGMYVLDDGMTPDDEVREMMEDLCEAYKMMVNPDGLNVCPEQARGVLPQGMLTEYYVTANMTAWNRFILQRTDPHAQKEIRILARGVQREIGRHLNGEDYDLFD